MEYSIPTTTSGYSSSYFGHSPLEDVYISSSVSTGSSLEGASFSSSYRENWTNTTENNTTHSQTSYTDLSEVSFGKETSSSVSVSAYELAAYTTTLLVASFSPNTASPLNFGFDLINASIPAS